MSEVFKGRPILPGNVSGESLVTKTGFNTLACFYKSMIERAEVATCGDKDNKELFGQILTGKIICLTKGIGSTTTGATWERIAYLGVNPKGMLFSEHIDSLSAAGLIIADIWVGKRIYTVDQLGKDFLEYAKTGCWIEIKEDGTVILD